MWDGVKEVTNCIDRVRAAIKYIRNSPARLLIFMEHVEKLKIECKVSLSLDVPTRWNSTYMMLETALKYQLVFGRFGLPLDLNGVGPPDDDDWKKIERLITFLKEFYELTQRVYGS